MKMLSIPLLLALGACSLTEAPVDYYQGRWDPPTVSSVDAAKQGGNVGGRTVTINGSNFGDDPAKLMVQFGNHNAEIVSATDSAIVVEVPAGPLGGGVVPVTVATYDGYATGEYDYSIADTLSGEGDGTTGQVGYVLVSNYWESCLGGRSGRMSDDYGATFDQCMDIAYVGASGTSASAEAIEFAVERLHAPTQGWSGAADVAAEGEWAVERPSESPYIGGTDDFHVDLGSVTLTNEYWSKEVPDGYCVDFSPTATVHYGGGDEAYPDAQTFGGAQFPDESEAGQDRSCESPARWYASDTLAMCSRPDSAGIDGFVYDGDWPINANFFQANDRNSVPVDVKLSMSNVGVSGVALTLPEPMVVYNTEGYDEIITDMPGAQDAWGAFGTMQHCFDDSSNGERLDDVALRFEWAPSVVEYPAPSGQVLGVHTYVRASITEMTVGWFGGLNNPIRATITVPDDNDAFNTTDVNGKRVTHAQLEVPASVMYQFPSVKFPGGGALGADIVNDGATHYGYMFIELQRVTEYTVQSDAGPVVLAYVTGDFGFTEWVNPTDDACHDCLDNDDDGWTDDKDPDCAAPGIEESGKGDTACNDGIDNDGDGDIDSEDELCDSATDKDESNCSDKLDNDGDGFKDAADADCARGDNETTADGCLDGSDNDGDGWVDSADPDCLTGAKEAGYGTTSCNDGVDDDGDGLTDMDDPECATAGSDEAGIPSCLDGADDDLDGWIDADDPDCTTGTSEAGLGTTGCNDGVDNDLDGMTDVDDADCVDASASESTALPCENGLDDDSDGWVDSLDPDCTTGSSELGTGSTQCNDGTDNDGNGDVDAADPDCVDAADDDESI